jgi:hypothetical protein
VVDKKADAARVRAYKLANPEKIRAANRRRYTDNRVATMEATRKWALANPERYAEIRRRASWKHRLKRYGLTVEQFNAMLAAQNYCCAICKSDAVGNKRNGKGAKRRLTEGWPTVAQQGDFTWHVDHDHKTGKVRGLLCHSCNAALGLMRDDPARLAAMIEYLKRS